MKVSVAMCTFNGAKFVGQQLMGIRWQTKPPYEVIVCDDGSTDRTLEIIRAYADQVPYPVRLVRNAGHQGLTKNYEKVIGLCTGEAIALCDQDDLWQPDKLRKLAGVLEREPDVGGVFSDGSLIDDNSRQLRGSLWERREFTFRQQAAFNRSSALNILLQRNVVTGSTLLFRYGLARQVTPIPQEWGHDAWLAVLIAAQARLVAVPEPLVSYRLHPTRQVGMTVSRWQESLHNDLDHTGAAHDLMAARWSLMVAKLASLQVDPAYIRLAQAKVKFLKTRSMLRDQQLFARIVGATSALPGYVRFSRGLGSYLRDLNSAGDRRDLAAEVGHASPWSPGTGQS